MRPLFRLSGVRARDPEVDAWLAARTGELSPIARRAFTALRGCGDEVRERLHDGHPMACIEDAAFAYVDAFTAHVNLGFFHGAALADPQGLLEGTGRFMRHVKLRPGAAIDWVAVGRLIEAAYADVMRRLAAEGPAE